LAVIRVTELNDFSCLLKDGLLIMEKFKDDVNTALWQMSKKVSVSEHKDAFLSFIAKAKELSKEPVDLFEAYYYYEFQDYTRALELYLQAYDNREEMMQADELADICSLIAQCYMHIPSPDPENALKAINKALYHDSLLIDFQNETSYLAIRAKIFVKMNEKEKALADLDRVLEYLPDDEDALALLKKIKEA
jgi:tetratricopeptide (TPR) repeat protein